MIVIKVGGGKDLNIDAIVDDIAALRAAGRPLLLVHGGAETTNEVAEALEQTIPSVKSALHRARATLAKYHPTLHSDSISTPATDEAFRKQLDRYVRAWEAADVDALVLLLRDDSTFSMPPIPSWYRGRENIGGLVRKTIFSGQASGRW